MLDFRGPMDNELSEMADERVLSLPVTELNEPLVDVRKVTNTYWATARVPRDRSTLHFRAGGINSTP